MSESNPKSEIGSKGKIKKTLCTFCGFGCELGIISDDFGLSGVEYLPDTPNQGRICPRGSASVLYLNHPRRLCVPVSKNKYTGWDWVKEEFKNMLKTPDEVAITVDRNITIEEEFAILNFSNKYKIKNVVSTYFEPETLLDRFIDENNPSCLEDIEKSQMVIVLGDIFNYAPMISKNLISWKFTDRKNRLVVIDSLHTHTSYYAADFLKTEPGTEALVLLSLAREKLFSTELQKLTGIKESVLQSIAEDFKSAKNGLIIAAMPFSHSYEPLLVVEGLHKLSEFSGKKVMPIFEFIHYRRLNPFGRVLKLIKDGEIKYIVNFGELFPFYYPQFNKELSGIKIYATSTQRFNNYVQLPAALNMEKSGTILTTFGKKPLDGSASGVSGAKNIIQLFDLLGVETGGSISESADAKRIDIKDGVKRMIEKIKQNRDGEFVLFGEKVSYYYLGLLEKPILKINPLDAQKYGIKDGEIVFVESKNNRIRMPVKITSDIPQGALFTQAEIPEICGLFDYEIVDDYLYFNPTGVRIWQEE